MIFYEHTVPLFLIILAVAAGLGVGLFGALRCFPRKPALVCLAVLYLLALLLVGWFLLMPGRKDALTRMLKPRFVVALDTSRSMTLSPSDEVPDRWTTAQRALDLPWTRAMAAQCEIVVVPFDAGTREGVPLADAGDLRPEGAATQVRESLQQIERRFAGVNLAGVLLLSDGVDTREAFDEWALDPRSFPVHTVRLEPDAEWAQEPDLRIDGVDCPRRVTVGWRTELRVMISGQGTEGSPVAVQLFEDGALLQEKPTRIPAQGGEREVLLEMNHPQVGDFKYRVHLPPLPGEVNTNDNEYVVSVQVTDAKNRLLYVEGVPRWEYRFLRRTLLAEPRITPAIFYTGADGEPKGGVPGSLITPDMSPSELALFKLVVLGNLDAEELGERRTGALVEFVEDGGSLVLLGGARAWGDGGFAGTDLRTIMPVRDHATSALTGDEPFAVRLTDEARSHPAFAGDPELWSAVPPVLSVFPGAEPLPGAQVLVVADTPEGPHPLVVTHRYGQGKVAAVFTDSLWKWQLSPEAGQYQPYARFWSQLISWLLPQEAERVQQAIELFADREQLFLGEEIELNARLGDGKKLEGPMECIMALPDQRRVPYAMEQRQVATPSGKIFPGYSLRFRAETPGMHLAVASARIGGRDQKSNLLSFYVKPYAPETTPRPIRADILQNIAEASGGQFFERIEDLDETLAELTPDAVEEETATYVTLWRTWPLLILTMVLLAGSWVLRKFLNMP